MLDSMDLALLCEPDITSPGCSETPYGFDRTADSKVACPCPYHNFADRGRSPRDPGLHNTSLAVGIRLGTVANRKHSAPLGRMLKTVCNRVTGPVVSVKASILLHLVTVQNLRIISCMETTGAVGLWSKKS